MLLDCGPDGVYDCLLDVCRAEVHRYRDCDDVALYDMGKESIYGRCDDVASTHKGVPMKI
jgi:hypothetical protein